MRSVLGFARLLAILLGAMAALEVVRTLFAAAWLASLVPESIEGPIWGGGYALLGLGMLLVVPMFAFFTFRTASNVRLREPDFYQGPVGGAIAWFIPGWNLYKPYDALCAIWSGTAGLADDDEPRGPGRLLEIFWATWVLSVIIGRVLGGGSDSALLGVGDLLAASLSAVSCVSGALAVLRLAQLQEEVLHPSLDRDRRVEGEAVAVVGGV